MVSETSTPASSAAQDEAFERLLFDSAKLDAPPPGSAQLALARFALGTATVTALVSTPSTPGTSRVVAKWLGVASLLSGAIIAAYFAGKGQVVTRPPSASPSAAMVVAPPAVAVKSAIPPALSAPALSPHAPRAPRAARTTPVTARAAAGLAEEVERLDAARTALAIGDFNAVSRELLRYQSDFPRGALAREAELVAISASHDQGDRAETSRRARAFLERYPRDVHAARVKELMSSQTLADEVK